MRTFSRYLLESPIDERPPTIKGQHPHITFDDYEVDTLFYIKKIRKEIKNIDPVSTVKMNNFYDL